MKARIKKYFNNWIAFALLSSGIGTVIGGITLALTVGAFDIDIGLSLEGSQLLFQVPIYIIHFYVTWYLMEKRGIASDFPFLMGLLVFVLCQILVYDVVVCTTLREKSLILPCFFAVETGSLLQSTVVYLLATYYQSFYPWKDVSRRIVYGLRVKMVVLMLVPVALLTMILLAFFIHPMQPRMATIVGGVSPILLVVLIAIVVVATLLAIQAAARMVNLLQDIRRSMRSLLLEHSWTEIRYVSDDEISLIVEGLNRLGSRLSSEQMCCMDSTVDSPVEQDAQDHRSNIDQSKREMS